ncbi:hypothetical protein HNQ07_003932 [Deinococcus metalli]|uniref:Uncharacterized protein n=1 Tax=Deinococcus metalli TaxID=1141878 RepID=A0A7W8NR09_9DEIO|nr:hypothetical protein [Deinococcus metalli]MBB5378426.1 hypothetical protein [Deinococcus metalli]GHF59059.1 hypothetical protein GCM10017781_39060 [Deinococcus metalli]
MTTPLTDTLSAHVSYTVEATEHRDVLHVIFSPEAAVRALLASGLDDAAFDAQASALAQRLGEAEATRRGLRDPAIDISGRYGDALDEVSPHPDNAEEMYQRLDREYGSTPG